MTLKNLGVTGFACLVTGAASGCTIAVSGAHEIVIPTVNSGPYGIACCSSDGAIWFTEAKANKIARVTRDGNSVIEMSVPTPRSAPHGITVSCCVSDLLVYFAESDANKIGRVSKSGSIAEFNIPTPKSKPESIISDDRGGAWFTELEGNKIGHIFPDGRIAEVAIPTPRSRPFAISRWRQVAFAESAARKIGVVEASGKVTEYQLPDHFGSPEWVYVGENPSSTERTADWIWFTSTNEDAIAFISDKGAIRQIRIPTDHSGPSGLTEGPKLTLWFAESRASKVGVLDLGPGKNTNHPQVTGEFTLSRQKRYHPEAIAYQPELGLLWFTDKTNNMLGNVRLQVPSYP